MDPVTHTLVGAALATTRLARTTRLAVPALVIGVNLPDVDILSYAAGGDAGLAFRRGWTHGLPAVALLPALLAATLWLWGRGREPQRRPSARRLLLLSYLACLTHPALDWLNTYGMRWGMPFSDRWSYGDAVFIMDPWLWLALGCGWLLGREPTPWLLAGLLAATVPLLAVVAGRAPEYVPLVAGVTAVLLASLLWRPPRRGPAPAGAGLALAALYIGSMILLQSATEGRVRGQLEALGVAPIAALMVGPRPADPRVWDVVVESRHSIRVGRFRWTDATPLELAEAPLRAARADPLWNRIERSGAVPGFRGWARFPWLETEPVEGGLRVYLMDARYVRRRTAGFGAATFILPDSG